MLDSLGDRIKSYEKQSKYSLNYDDLTIIRLDGKGFSKYTKMFKKPYDESMMLAMDETTEYLCKNIEGVLLGYCQSDEITLGLPKLRWFGAELQKITSISASMASAKFNNSVAKFTYTDKLACFDSRAFNVPTKMEFYNSFEWRQQDCRRNAIQSLAQHLYSSKQIFGLNIKTQIDLIESKLNQKVDTYLPEGFLLGRSFIKESYLTDVEFLNPKSNKYELKKDVFRSEWRKKHIKFKDFKNELLHILELPLEKKND